MKQIKMKKPEGGLLQTREWASVMEQQKKEVVTIKTTKHIFYGFVFVVAKYFKYVYFPRIVYDREFFEHIKKMHFSWVRCDFIDVVDIAKKQIHNDILIKKAPVNIQPAENFIIDITPSEEILLAQMKSKTRYNIRLAQKKGVKIIVSNDKMYRDCFYDLVKQTEQRKSVQFHSKKHYELILNTFSKEKAMLYNAVFANTVIASNLITVCDDVATYLHGATSNQYRNVMAPFLLQWRTICDVKEKNKCTFYDFGGVFTHTNDVGKRGITRFKKGFSPQEHITQTSGTYDIILKPNIYNAYRFAQKIKSYND